MNSLIYLLIVALANTALTTTIVTADPLHSLRQKLADKSQWTAKLLACTYCLSHWIALGLIVLCNPAEIPGVNFVGRYLLSIFAVVALTRAINGVYIRLYAVKNAPRPKSIEGGSQT